jgi:glycosyltransferase involved in cell wall biosynthesis
MDESEFVMRQLPTQRNLLRIAVVTETYPPEVNGVAMTIGRLVGALQARDHQVQLVRPRQGADDHPTPGENLEQVLKPGFSIPNYEGLKMGLPAKFALQRMWGLRRPDVVHIATEGPLGWSALAAAGKLRIPVATDFHTNFHSYSKHYGLGFLRRAIVAYLRKFHNKAQVTMAPTEGIRLELAGHGYRNLKVVARGVDAELFNPGRRRADLRRAWGAGDDDLVTMVVGRLAPEKNLPLAIAAFRAMCARAPATRMVLVGDGPEREALQARHPDIVFAGMRTGVDLAEHYASADVFLFPSLTETYGNVTIEAMASGLAVLAYNYAAAEEHVRMWNNGITATFDDHGEFIARAADLAAHPQRVRALGRAAAAYARTLSWETIFDHFEQVLLDTVSEFEQERAHVGNTWMEAACHE